MYLSVSEGCAGSHDHDSCQVGRYRLPRLVCHQQARRRRQCHPGCVQRSWRCGRLPVEVHKPDRALSAGPSSGVQTPTRVALSL